MPTRDQPEETTAAKLFEEVKVMVRDLGDRIQTSSRGKSRRLRRLHPMMLEEMFFHPELRRDPESQAAAWLMAISTLRDDAPWLYEPGLELYRALRAADPDKIASARESLQRMMKVLHRGPLFHEIVTAEDEDAFMLLRHLPELLDRTLARIDVPRRKPRTKDTESS